MRTGRLGILHTVSWDLSPDPRILRRTRRTILLRHLHTYPESSYRTVSMDLCPSLPCLHCRSHSASSHLATQIQLGSEYTAYVSPRRDPSARRRKNCTTQHLDQQSCRCCSSHMLLMDPSRCPHYQACMTYMILPVQHYTGQRSMPHTLSKRPCRCRTSPLRTACTQTQRHWRSIQMHIQCMASMHLHRHLRCLLCTPYSL